MASITIELHPALFNTLAAQSYTHAAVLDKMDDPDTSREEFMTHNNVDGEITLLVINTPENDTVYLHRGE